MDQSPMHLSTEELEQSLSTILYTDQINTVIKAVEASTSKGPTAERLSKLWIINEELAAGALDQNTQLARHSSDNILSRQISTNDRMLR